MIYKFFQKIKHRVYHKLEHFKFSNLKKTFKENGIALVVIIIMWEIIEDILFPLFFIFLGKHVHPAFYAGAPASWILCLHWIAVPITWGVWCKIKGKK